LIDTRITLRKLEIFERVAKLESVSRAAESLWLSQPVVTAHIRSIEEKVGAPLFRRRARRMELTEAGEVVHRWAADLLGRTTEAGRELERLTAGSRGDVLVGASISVGSYVLPPIFSRARHDRPLVSAQLRVAEYPQVIEAVAAEAVDFGIVASPGRPGGQHLVAERIGSDELVAVAAVGGEPAASRVTRAQFAELPLVEIASHAAMVRELDRAGIQPREVALELGHPEGVKRAVRAGLGVSVLSRSAVEDELEEGTMREFVVEDVDLALDVYLVHREGKRFGPAQQFLLDRIRAHFV
jgi:DNA-binding transcriptional LysR family regulator